MTINCLLGLIVTLIAIVIVYGILSLGDNDCDDKTNRMG